MGETISTRREFGDSPQEVINKMIIQMQKGRDYCLDSAEHWAELKTFNLSKELILFNLGVMAFLGAMRGEYQIKEVLFIALVLSGLSMISSFWFIWVVVNENINNVNKRQKIIENFLEEIIKAENMEIPLNTYNIKMAEVSGEMRGKEKFFNWLQKSSIFTFILGLGLAIFGLFFK